MTNASNILETGKEELSTQVARYEKRLDKLRKIYVRDVKNKNKKIEDFKQQVAKLYEKLSDEVDKVNPRSLRVRVFYPNRMKKKY